MSSQIKEVDQFIEQLTHPMKEAVKMIRSTILGADEQITEHIKWNAPSFCYEGEDRVTLNLHAEDRIQLIFHRGAKVKDSTGFVFKDDTGLFKWSSPDRAIVTFSGIEEVETKKSALADLVIRWMKSTSS
ncbi:MAG: hypothetical protein K0S20_120 [Patescibacteria group bacterium]|nr:hypothetical protein [Patescibacteria group bacterium]